MALEKRRAGFQFLICMCTNLCSILCSHKFVLFGENFLPGYCRYKMATYTCIPIKKKFNEKFQNFFGFFQILVQSCIPLSENCTDRRYLRNVKIEMFEKFQDLELFNDLWAQNNKKTIKNLWFKFLCMKLLCIKINGKDKFSFCERKFGIVIYKMKFTTIFRAQSSRTLQHQNFCERNRCAWIPFWMNIW